jgi:Rhs element Vgr protein
MNVVVTISSNGTPMGPSYQLLSLSVQREVNRIPHAELTLRDGNASTRKWDISDKSVFEPGAEVEIKLRSGNGPDTSVFKGPVMRHSLEADRTGSRLVVGMKDAAVKLTGSRRSAVYSDQSDSDIAKKILGDAKLKAGSIKDTTANKGQVVQYYCTDWDFIVSRADAHGFCVVLDDGEFSIKDLSVTESPALKLEWGISEILDLDLDADVHHQFAAVESQSWDIKNLQMTSPVSAKSASASQGNLDAAKIASAVGFSKCSLISPVPLESAELKVWAEGTLAKSRAAMLRGRVTIVGTIALKLLDVVEFAGCGSRFNGKALVTGLSHRVNENGWVTDVQFGLSPKSFSATEGVIDAPAAGLLPGLLGLQIGIVTDADDDPDKEFRVRVTLPGITTGDAVVWARLCAPDAGKQRGYFFRPEVGDEVLVGFLNNDPRHPIVLGSLFGSNNAPPDDFNKDLDKNKFKGIVTKSGATISFLDDEKSSVFIQTPGKNKILLDDDAKSIKLTDQNGNVVTMDENGIEMKSAKDFKINASSGNVEILGSQVDIK